MVKRKPPYRARLNRALLHTVWCAALMMPAEVLVIAHNLQKPGKPASLLNYTGAGSVPMPVSEPLAIQAASITGNGQMLPNLLSRKDIDLYQAALIAQKK